MPSWLDTVLKSLYSQGRKKECGGLLMLWKNGMQFTQEFNWFSLIDIDPGDVITAHHKGRDSFGNEALYLSPSRLWDFGMDSASYRWMVRCAQHYEYDVDVLFPEVDEWGV